MQPQTGSRAARWTNKVFKFAILFAFLATGCLAASNSTSTSSISGSAKQHAASLTATAAAARQSAATVLGALGSLVPGLISNVAPLVILFGLGAMMMPALSMSAMSLLRESRRSANDQFGAALASSLPPLPLASMLLNQQPQQQQPHFGQVARPLASSPQDVYYFTKRSAADEGSSAVNSAIVNGLHELLTRVNRAIENADKKYN